MAPTRIAEEQASDGSDLLRSDEPESGSLHDRMRDAGQLGATWGSHIPLPNLQEEN